MPKQQMRRPSTGANAGAVTQDAREAWRRCQLTTTLSEAKFTIENQRLEVEVYHLGRLGLFFGVVSGSVVKKDAI